MDFVNPANGHVESKSTPWLWTLLFGGLYFIVSGLWTHVLIWFVLSFALFATIGPPAILLMILIQLVYAAFADDIVSNSYLNKGWVPAGAAGTEQAGVRSCPYCAEDIKMEAIKCKHCGSDLAVATGPKKPGANEQEAAWRVRNNIT